MPVLLFGRCPLGLVAPLGVVELVGMEISIWREGLAVDREDGRVPGRGEVGVGGP